MRELCLLRDAYCVFPGCRRDSRVLRPRPHHRLHPDRPRADHPVRRTHSTWRRCAGPITGSRPSPPGTTNASTTAPTSGPARPATSTKCTRSAAAHHEEPDAPATPASPSRGQGMPGHRIRGFETLADAHSSTTDNSDDRLSKPSIRNHRISSPSDRKPSEGVGTPPQPQRTTTTHPVNFESRPDPPRATSPEWARPRRACRRPRRRSRRRRWGRVRPRRLPRRPRRPRCTKPGVVRRH